MAITRAQQVRQMLEDGGMLVQPSMTGKRPGYRGPGGYQGSDPDTGKGGASKGSSGGGGNKSGGGGGGGNQNTGNAREDYITNYVSKSRVKGPKVIGLDGKETDSYSVLTPTQIDNARKFKEEQDKKRSTAIFSNRSFNPFPIATSVLNKISNSKLAKYNNLFQRNNYLRTLTPEQQVEILEALAEEEEIGTTNPMGIDRNIQRGMGTYDYMDPEKVDKGFLGTGIGAGKFVTDIEFGGKDAKDVINEVTDGGYDDYLDRNKTDNTGGDNDPVEQDPCKGPNPPAYCFIGRDADDNIEVQRNLGGLAPRFAGSIFDFTGMADGGRIGAAEGGIMDLETAREAMFLGGIVKGLKKITKKATRAVKKVAKSPIGKAALLGLGAYYMPGFGIKATGGFSNFTQPGGFLSKILTKGGDKALNLDNLSGLKIAGLLTAAPFLFGQQEEEDDPDPNRGPKLTMEELLAIRGAPFNTLAPRFTGSTFAAEGGRMGYQKGSKEPVAKKVMPLLDMGGKEMDLRDNGGFVPIGRMEKADDVPARLSKNEFVFTADAVRNAGDGDVDKGSEVMYNMMKNLESGGEVSEESQGLKGAREMFQTAQRLEEVI
jgi:hypothetical protein